VTSVVYNAENKGGFLYWVYRPRQWHWINSSGRNGN